MAKIVGWVIKLGTLAGLGYSSWRCWREGYWLEAFALLEWVAIIIWLSIPRRRRA